MKFKVASGFKIAEVDLYLKGGALYISVIISIICGCLFMLLMLGSHHSKRMFLMSNMEIRLTRNLENGFSIAQSRFFTPEKNMQWLSINGLDSVRIKKELWGSYWKLYVEAKENKRVKKETGLYGVVPQVNGGLFVVENGSPITGVGRVEMQTDCYLPKDGFKAGQLNGQVFSLIKAAGTNIHSSPNVLENASEEFRTALISQFETVEDDSLLFELTPHFKNSFSNRTVAYYHKTDRLEKVKFVDNIKVFADDLEVYDNCQLENILIICKKVTLKKGFKGKVHVLASEEIICEEDVDLHYPSSLTVISDGEVAGRIIIEDRSRIAGNIITLRRRKDDSERKVMLKLGEGTSVTGFVYSENFLQASGEVRGKAMCKKLIIQSGGSLYENYLGNFRISGIKSSAIADPPIFIRPGKLICCLKNSF